MSFEPNVIPVVTACDENYAPYLSVMVGSLLENAAIKRKIHLYIIDNDLSLSSKNKLEKMAEKKDRDVTIEFISINKDIYKDFVTTHRYIDYITLTAYFRISLSQFLQEERYPKVIYLDADMLILDDINKLYEVDLNGKTIGAVIDLGAPMRTSDLGIKAKSYYFNSGLLVIDLKQWNEKDIAKKAIEFLTKNGDKVYYHDQDALNVALPDDWHPIHPKWNMQLKWDIETFSTYDSRPAPDKYYDKLYTEGRKNPSIIHPTGHIKPWDLHSRHPFQAEYLKRIEEWHSLKEISKQ